MDLMNELDRVAGSLEQKGLVKEAYELDMVSNTLEAAGEGQVTEMDFRPTLRALQGVANVYPPTKDTMKGTQMQDVELNNGAFIQIALDPNGHADLNGAPFKMVLMDRETRRPTKMPVGKVFLKGNEGAMEPRELIQKVRLVSNVPPEMMQKGRQVGQRQKVQQRTRKRMQAVPEQATPEV